MKEYIERPVLVGKLTSSEVQHAMREMDGNQAYSFFLTLVNNEPAADVVEVKRGRWEVYLDGKYLMCSACKASFWDENGDGGSNFCPNCGANMKED